MLSFASGDRFLLYTDGVVESDQDGEEFGVARLKQILSRPLPANQVCMSIGQEVSSWSRAVAGDDVTIVAVEVA